jgi:hypothetical protein
MPTAIITVNTPRGFFLAADGRTRKEEHGVFTVLSSTQQKVFEIGDHRAHFAFAVTGTAAFSAEGEEEIIFDFNKAIREAADGLTHTICADAMNYSQRLVKIVTKMLKDSVAKARASGKTVNYPSNDDPQGQGHSMIVMLFLCGYYSQSPCHILFKFFHRSGVVAAPLICRIFRVGENMFSGSREVTERLYVTNDPRFAAFRHSAQNPADVTFLEWAAIAKGYVEACESSIGLALDAVICPSIGGHVHAATVTHADRFKWVPAFEPIITI